MSHTMLRRFITVPLLFGLLLMSLSASADHRLHYKDVAEDLLAGALAVFTIGVVVEEINDWYGKSHSHDRPKSNRSYKQYQHTYRGYGRNHRYSKGIRHGARHHHRFGHRTYHRPMHQKHVRIIKGYR